MANHIAGDAWDLLVRGARESDWVILPVGCLTCVTGEAQLAHLGRMSARCPRQTRAPGKGYWGPSSPEVEPSATLLLESRSFSSTKSTCVAVSPMFSP